mmetsp:Transcript_5941/g.18913  ORF Transcript_5941/g.18913 Transcript_5941/m.18913 type:complete len:262 (+) Transcript_5941:441-1226(+)
MCFNPLKACRFRRSAAVALSNECLCLFSDRAIVAVNSRASEELAPSLDCASDRAWTRSDSVAAKTLRSWRCLNSAASCSARICFWSKTAVSNLSNKSSASEMKVLSKTTLLCASHCEARSSTSWTTISPLRLSGSACKRRFKPCGGEETLFRDNEETLRGAWRGGCSNKFFDARALFFAAMDSLCSNLAWSMPRCSACMSEAAAWSTLFWATPSVEMNVVSRTFCFTRSIKSASAVSLDSSSSMSAGLCAGWRSHMRRTHS